MNDQWDLLLAFLREHHPQAERTFSALTQELSWKKIHEEVVSENITRPWVKFITKTPRHTEACMNCRDYLGNILPLNALRALTRATAKDSRWAYYLRRRCKTLEEKEQLLLTRGTLKKPEWACYLRMNCSATLSAKEHLILARGIAKNPEWGFYLLSTAGSMLSSKERRILIRGVVKNPKWMLILGLIKDKLSIEERAMLTT